VGLEEGAAALGVCRSLTPLPAPAELQDITQTQIFLLFQVRKTVNQKINGKIYSVYYFFKDLVY